MAGERRIRDPERRERILEVAAALIAKRGYTGVSLGEVGSAAGIVGSGIYRHFENKVGILVELFDRVVDRLIVDAENCLKTYSTPEEILAALVRGQVRFTIDERALCQVYLQEARNLPEADARRLRWKQRHYLDLWQEILAATNPDRPPPQVQGLVHAAISTIHSSVRYRNHMADDELGAFLEETACRVLGLPPLPASVGEHGPDAEQIG